MTNNQKFSVSAWNFNKVPAGTYFTATIDDEKVSGLVFKENNYGDLSIVFYFNNSDADVDGPSNGFPHSVEFNYNGHTTNTELENEISLVALDFPPKPRNFKLPIVIPKFGNWEAEIHSGYVIFGCQTVLNSVVKNLVKELIPKGSRKRSTYSTYIAGKRFEIRAGYVSIDWGSFSIPNEDIILLAKNLKP